jgi:hypothetical protein
MIMDGGTMGIWYRYIILNQLISFYFSYALTSAHLSVVRINGDCTIAYGQVCAMRRQKFCRASDET